MTTVARDESIDRAELASAVLEAVPDGYAYTEGGAIVTVNDAFCRITGRPREQLIGARDPFPFWPDGTHRANRELIARAKASDGGAFTTAFRHSAGHEVDVELTVHPVPGPDGVARGYVTVVRDITERVAEHAALVASEQQFRLTFDTSPIGIALVGLDGVWTQVNPALCALLGHSRAELLATTFQAITHPDDLEADLNLVDDLVAGRLHNYTLDKRYLRRDGSAVWASLHVALVRDAAGRPSHFIAQITDITDRRAQHDHLATLATTDPLTGLANRRAWEHRLDMMLDGRGPVAVAILDLDHFKVFNDSRGHPAGDELLRRTAAAWSATLHAAVPDGVLARLGGEEFAFAVSGPVSAQAVDLARALLDAVTHDQHASCGVTLSTAGDSRATLMARADTALYAAKRNGRNRVVLLSDTHVDIGP